MIEGYFSAGIIDRLGIRYFPLHHEGNYLHKLFLYIGRVFQVFVCAPFFGIVHIHTASWWSFRKLFPIMLWSKIFARKIVIHIHGAMFDVYFRDSGTFEKNLIRWAFSMADRVVVLSSDWSKKVSSFCNPSKILIITNSVPSSMSSEFFDDKNIKCPRIMLFMGKLGKRKGVYDLLKSIALLKERGYTALDFKVVLCGNGEIKEVLKEVQKLCLIDIVRVEGWVSGVEKEKLFKDAYIYVLPSYFEGLPMSILEAMARGIPVISTHVGGIPDAIENGVEGLLIEPGDTRGLAIAIETLLSDGELWRRMSLMGIKKAKEKFSPKTTLTLLENLYKGLNSQQTNTIQTSQ